MWRGGLLGRYSPAATRKPQVPTAGIANHVLGLGLYQLHHSRDDVARSAELAVLAGRGDLRQHVLVHITLSVSVAHIELIELVDDLGEQRRPRDLETGICACGVRRREPLPFSAPDEREYALVHDPEHLRAREMLEARPAEVCIGLAPFVLHRPGRCAAPAEALGSSPCAPPAPAFHRAV